MAIIPVTLAVGFTSDYPGNHRVCYRLGPSGPYDCSTIVTCAGGGSPCSVNINLTIDNETCDAYEYEGYVQAACEDIGSLIGRIPFTASITPVAPCQAKTVTCTGGLAAVSLTTIGTGYNAGVPAVNVIGGGGSGAVVSVTMVGDTVSGLSIVNPGSGYTSLPTITIDPSPTGIDATAIVTELTGCGDITMTDCNGTTLTIENAIIGVNLNNNPTVPKIFCIQEGSTFTPAAEYLIADSGCCYDCTTYEVTSGESGGSFNYQKCTGEYVEGPSVGEGVTVIDCMITGSVSIIVGVDEINYGWDTTNLGPCTP